MNASPDRLRELQDWMAGALIDPVRDPQAPPAPGSAEGWIVADLKGSSSERLEVYRRQYEARLREILERDYSAVKALLGEEAFRELCGRYLAAHPPQSYLLRELGRELAQFIESDPDAPSGRERAADLARLEYAVLSAYERPEEPALTLLSLRHPADRLLVALKNQPDAPPPKTPMERTLLAVHRQKGVVCLKSLKERDYAALKLMEEGVDWPEASRRLLDEIPAKERPRVLRRLEESRREWEGLGWLKPGSTPHSGLALMLVVGILTLLMAVALAIAGLAGRLHEGAGAGTDRAAARLLALSGVEYGAARLIGGWSPPVARTVENQPDDWTFRDDAGVPIEKSLNPSYARTEPYADVYPLANPAQAVGGGSSGGNGRYDAGKDTYTDLDGNNRFDSWSGRLRGRHGLTGDTFALKISGENADGGVNVNGGWMYDTTDYGDLTPDYRDLGGNSPGLNILYDDPLARNRRVAFTINQLGLLLGIAQPRPGDLIVKSRRLGGYRSVEEMAGLFLPADWDRLRPHLTVASRRNSACFLEPAANLSGPDPRYHPWFRLPDARYLVNVEAADPVVLAAAFSGLGKLVDATQAWGRELFASEIVTPAEALKLADFLKKEPFVSELDLYRRLAQRADDLFVGAPEPRYSGVDARSPSEIARSKAVVVHALAIPEELGSRMLWNPNTAIGHWPEYLSWMTYDQPPVYGQPSARWFKRWTVNEEVSSWRGQELGFGPSGIRSILSLGRVRGTRDSLAARARAGGICREGTVAADTQEEFEGTYIPFWGWTGSSSQKAQYAKYATGFNFSRRFPGGTCSGRGERDRATTHPFFSMETLFGPHFEEKPYCYYEKGYGEVRLLDRSWVDDEASLYLPYWDIHHPGHPGAAAIAAGSTAEPWDHLLREEQHGFETELYGKSRPAGLSLGVEYQAAPPVLTGGFAANTLRWGDVPAGTYANPGPPPWIDPLSGRIEAGTIAFWTHSAVNSGAIGIAQGKVASGTAQHSLSAYFLAWRQTRGDDASFSAAVTTHAWVDPSPPVTEDCRDHAAFSFSPEGMEAFLNGIYRGGTGFDSFAWDPNRGSKFTSSLSTYGIGEDEIRLYRRPLAADEIRARHALRGRFWTADPDGRIPSFTSCLYRFDGPASLTSAQWDGFVPGALEKAWRDAAGADGGKPPLRAELLLYPGPKGEGEPVVVPLPEDSWKTGGGGISLHPALRCASLRWRAWLDASVDDLRRWTPVFDGIVVHFVLANAVETTGEEW